MLDNWSLKAMRVYDWKRDGQYILRTKKNNPKKEIKSS
jgi:hypothetical protein